MHTPPASRNGLALLPLIRQGLAFALIACTVCASSAQAEQPLPEAANLETAKSDVLQLDRELSRLEQKRLFPLRTLVLFGMSPTLDTPALTLKLSINGKQVSQQRLESVQLDSLRQGGKLALWANNLRVGKHQLTIELQPEGDANRPPITEQITLNKRQNRQVLGVQWVEPNRVNPSQVRWIEWPDYD